MKKFLALMAVLGLIVSAVAFADEGGAAPAGSADTAGAAAAAPAKEKHHGHKKGKGHHHRHGKKDKGAADEAGGETK